MRVLVAGGAGFVGSGLVRGLLGGEAAAPGDPYAGASVTVLDLQATAGAATGLAPVAGHPRLRLVAGDICDAGLVADLLPGHDAVVNLAAQTHVDRSISDGAEFARTNVLGAQTLLEAAVRAGVRVLVQVSTDEVYGSVPDGVAAEDAPLRPSSPYSATKAAADLLAAAYWRTHGLDTRVTRACNTYGPWQAPDKVVPLFVTELLDGRTLPLYGDGRHVREWLHVDDHCRAIRLVLAAGAAGGVYNVGSGRRLSNRELTGRLLAACGAGWDRVREVADRPGHDLRYAVDATAITGLGFAPAVDLDAGLAGTVRWYADHRPWWEPLKRSLPPLR